MLELLVPESRKWHRIVDNRAVISEWVLTPPDTAACYNTKFKFPIQYISKQAFLPANQILQEYSR